MVEPMWKVPPRVDGVWKDCTKNDAWFHTTATALEWPTFSTMRTIWTQGMHTTGSRKNEWMRVDQMCGVLRTALFACLVIAIYSRSIHIITNISIQNNIRAHTPLSPKFHYSCTIGLTFCHYTFTWVGITFNGLRGMCTRTSLSLYEVGKREHTA
jgi:hypothetical protein